MAFLLVFVLQWRFGAAGLGDPLILTPTNYCRQTVVDSFPRLFAMSNKMTEVM